MRLKILTKITSHHVALTSLGNNVTMSQHPISEIPNLHLDIHCCHGQAILSVAVSVFLSLPWWECRLVWGILAEFSILQRMMVSSGLRKHQVWCHFGDRLTGFVLKNVICDSVAWYIIYIYIYQIISNTSIIPKSCQKVKELWEDNMFYYMEFITHRSMELSTWDHLPVCMAVAEIVNRQKTSISISQYIIDTLWISNCVINFVVLSKTFNLKGTTIHSFSSHLCRIPEVQTQLYLSQNQGPHGPWLHHKKKDSQASSELQRKYLPGYI